MRHILSAKCAWERILFILAFFLFVLTVVYMFTIWNLGFHSDSAAANMLMREQIRTRQLFPETWNYSTGLTIFSFNILMLPLSLLIQDQIILRTAAVTIYLVAFILLLCYFSKKILKSNFYLISCILFFSGTSSLVIEIAFAQAAYLKSLVQYFVLFILFLLSVKENWEIKNIRCFVVFLIYLSYLNLYGPLNFAYYNIPLFGGIGLLFFFQHSKSSGSIVFQELCRIIKIVVPMTAAVVVGFIGYLGISRHVNFRSGTNITYPGNSELANNFVRFVLKAIGYQPGVRLFSLRGIMNALIICGFIGIVACCVLLFLKYNEQPFSVKIFMNISLIVVLIHIYFDFTVYCNSVDSERYFFRPLMFLTFLASYYIYNYIFSKGVLTKAVVIALLAAFSLPCMLANVPQVVFYPQSRDSQLGLVHFLKENELDHGYATFWNAGKNMVLSDFAIEIGGINLTDPISPYLWLSSTTSYDPATFNGRSFLLLSKSENEEFSNSYGFQRLGEPEKVLTFGNFVIYVYPYNISENNFFGAGIAEFIDSMRVSNPSMRDVAQGIQVTAGEVIYGPYIPLNAGRYQITLEFSELEGNVSLLLTSDVGKNVIQKEIIEQKVQTIFLETDKNLKDFEIVLRTNDSAVLTSVVISEVK